jgi:hypothetical protein
LIRIERSGVYPEEIVFISIVIIVWVIAVFVFLKQWNSIRILEPIEPRFKHAPKNLENIRIVKRTQDSVIYKGYSRKLSITMVEREKKTITENEHCTSTSSYWAHDTKHITHNSHGRHDN